MAPAVVSDSFGFQADGIDDDGALLQSPIETLELAFESVFEFVLWVVAAAQPKIRIVLGIPDALQKLVLKSRVVHRVPPELCRKKDSWRGVAPPPEASELWCDLSVAHEVAAMPAVSTSWVFLA
ncbi:hypothetical protein QTI17_12890 [Variovorax sp. J31P179]|nr:hypothetical protein [Variovorax sp. J31P179]